MTARRDMTLHLRKNTTSSYWISCSRGCRVSTSAFPCEKKKNHTPKLPTVVRLIEEAHFGYCEIITSAYWTANEKMAIRILKKLQNAITTRKQHGQSFCFSLRVSLDYYHQKIVKLEWIKRLIDILRQDALLPIEKQSYPDIKLFFRTLLIEDKTIEQFAALLQAKLTPLKNYMRELRFTDAKVKGISSLLVFYKDMRYIGRGKQVNASKSTEFNQFFDSYANIEQDVRLGMTYLNPGSKGEVLKGINVFITHEGCMMPYGGVADVSMNIRKKCSYSSFLQQLFRDIISRTLLLKGLHHVQLIVEEIDPEIAKRIHTKNWLASIADEALATPALRLYVTIRLYQLAIQKGELNIAQLSKDNQRLILMRPTQLKKDYIEYSKHAKNVTYTYGNEVVTVRT